MDVRREWSVAACLELHVGYEEKIGESIGVILSNLRDAGVELDLRRSVRDDINTIVDWVADHPC